MMRLFAHIALALSLLLALPAADAWAGQRDQNTARDSYKSDKVLPYSQIKRRAESIFGGRVVGQNVNRRGGRVVYNLKILRQNGQVISAQMDGETGRVLSSSRGR
ncbi:MAG: hypothetical protein MI755_05360 [Sphingomonadales bacterium]|nr:hypothetical protein [Sphingomonadales bacterium]